MNHRRELPLCSSSSTRSMRRQTGQGGVRLSIGLSVAPVALALRSLRLGVLAAIRRQRATHSVALLEAALLVTSHVAFVGACVDQLPASRLFAIEPPSRPIATDVPRHLPRKA